MNAMMNAVTSGSTEKQPLSNAERSQVEINVFFKFRCRMKVERASLAPSSKLHGMFYRSAKALSFSRILCVPLKMLYKEYLVTPVIRV